MTRKRVTKEEKEQRQQWAVVQIDKGVGFSELTSLTSETWGVSRSEGYKLIKRAWQQIKNDIDESGIDRQELLSW